MEIGYFNYIEKEGTDPVEVPGEKMDVAPKCFSKPVSIGIYRSNEGFVVCDFATGMKLHNGRLKQTAIDNAVKWMETVKETAYKNLTDRFEVINTSLREHYGHGPQMPDIQA